ncbi:MAG: retroviral-like aspartic protease family protein [Dysgonamonadaceae bacterium]|jgi:predicted aspartyl protease|nr:retroviral-like aspartic protease family protein [Dysgonamonadaceae bacterium]
MKNIKKMLFASITWVLVCSCTTKNDADFDRQMSELLANKNYFHLRENLAQAKNKLSKDRFWYYAAHCEQVFGNGQLSNDYADRLLTKFDKKLDESIKVELLALKANNYIRDYQYKNAAEIYYILAAQDSAEAASYKNMSQLFGSLRNVKQQIIHNHDDTEISAYRNQWKHLMTPVKCKGIDDEFIFDSGANFSTITDSCAIKLGLNIINSDIKVGTATNTSVQSRLAVADSLYVGGILFENVVFLVMPAAAMTFPAINYAIHGIIGFPVLFQMGEFRMNSDGKIFVPKEPVDKHFNNMFLEGLNPVVRVFSKNDTLLLSFDTGANSSELSKKYYDKHKAEVEAEGKFETEKRGSANGIVEVSTYKLQNFPYIIGSKSNVLPQIDVMLDEYHFTKSLDGNLGQDIITQFNTLIMNFKYMYIDFE